MPKGPGRAARQVGLGLMLFVVRLRKRTDLAGKA